MLSYIMICEVVAACCIYFQCERLDLVVAQLASHGNGAVAPSNSCTSTVKAEAILILDGLSHQNLHHIHGANFVLDSDGLPRCPSTHY